MTSFHGTIDNETLIIYYYVGNNIIGHSTEAPIPTITNTHGEFFIGNFFNKLLEERKNKLIKINENSL